MKKLAALVLVFFISGCAATAPRGGTRGFLPRIPKPMRPVLSEMSSVEVLELKKIKPETVKKIQGNMKALYIYTTKMEIGIDAYNAYVRTNNALVRQELGMPPGKDIEAKMVEEEK